MAFMSAVQDKEKIEYGQGMVIQAILVTSHFLSVFYRGCFQISLYFITVELFLLKMKTSNHFSPS